MHTSDEECTTQKGRLKHSAQLCLSSPASPLCAQSPLNVESQEQRPEKMCDKPPGTKHYSYLQTEALLTTGCVF